MIAVKTNLKVIGGFRLSDMKVGGQGAPLAPYFHEYISSKEKPFINILNLGGFANWTFKSDNKLMAYDTGPANYLIDLISNKYFNVPYDKNGSLAKKGKINDEALVDMLSDRFFDQAIPKSTGFERFNFKWLTKFINKFKLTNKSSMIATVSQLTIISISDAINSSHLDSQYIFFAGGGSRNSFIKKEILKRTGLIETKSIPGNFDYKNLESSAFAWLAMKRDQAKLITKPYLTGAKSNRKLGTIYR
jgi:anhydro-N-acetylmuramic acid kinase